ncbi:MAG TPA: hypothetical protein VGG56_05290 [Terracidiphilus sp.]|jgi:hypothetical protein
MKREVITTLSLAAASFVLLLPAIGRAQSNVTALDAQQEAMQMVSARVALKQNIDADKVKPGDPIRTTLSNKVHLKNGTELPAGTAILGVVAKDEMQTSGMSRLALNFNQAELKNGTTIPIKATIVGVFPPEAENADGSPVMPGDQVTDNWSSDQIAVNEIGALPGVDLHSAIASNNSGVLVSTSKHDMKLRWGSEIALAVAPQPSAGE